MKRAQSITRGKPLAVYFIDHWVACGVYRLVAELAGRERGCCRTSQTTAARP